MPPRGRKLSLETRNYKSFGELTWNVGRAFHGLNDIGKATEYFQKSCNCFMSVDNLKEANRLKKVAEDKYGVIILNYIV